MENSESRLKCFLHFGNEQRFYVPNGNSQYTFKPEMVGAIEELLQNDEWADKIVPMILKVNQFHTSIEPCALLYALAMVIRKAKGNKNNAEKNIAETKNDSAGSSETTKKEYKPDKFDLIVRDAYMAARKLSENETENLLMFTYYLREIAKTENKKGFGKGWRQTVDKWYTSPTPMALAKSVTKLYSNVSWTHSDLLTLRRWNGCPEKARDAVLLFARYNFSKANGKYEKDDDADVKSVMKYLKLIEDLRHAPSPEHALEFVAHPDITLDYVPPILLTSHTVWSHLIPKMPPEQLLSLINRLSKMRMFKHPEIVAKVVAKFEELEQPTIHPMHVFITRKRYEEGPQHAMSFYYRQQSQRIQESLQNEEVEFQGADPAQLIAPQHRPRRNQDIINCLNSVFNKTILSLAPTGKRFLIGLDVKASRSRNCYFERFVTVEEASLLVVLCVLKAETGSNVKLVRFYKTEEDIIEEIPTCRLEETMDSLKTKIYRDNSISANVEHLIKYATVKKEPYDMFIVLGDNLLEPGGAEVALRAYQNEVNPKAKLVTCCFTGRHKKFRELTKPDMLLICGFDKNVGDLIQAFSRDAF